MTEVETPPTPRIAAIVCTYNRADMLSLCLKSLCQQTIDPEIMEIIVVDNNSTDNTAEIAAEFSKQNAHIRVFHEAKQGLAAARNRGMRETRAPIVAFTDDDAEPAVDWLSRLLARFDALDEDVVAVGGEVIPMWEVARPAWLDAPLLHPLSAHLGWSQTPRLLRGGEWLCEVNSAYRKEAVQDFGGFPEALGRIGTNLLSGENAVNILLSEAGYRFYFDPGIEVKHHIAASRTQKSWFRRRMFWQGVTGYYVNKYLAEMRPRVAGRSPLGGVLENPADRGDAPVRITLPTSANAWANMFDDSVSDEFSSNVGQLWGLGYTMASQGLIHGR